MKTIIGIIVLVVLVGVGIAFFSNQTPPSSEPVTDNTETAEVVAPVQDDIGQPSSDGNQTVDEPVSPPPASPQVVEVVYTAQGFSPASITVHQGDTVRFVNESGSGMWVASAAHPTHTAYAGTSLSAHCGSGSANDAFDQCTTGDAYSFTFDKVGTWKYHNHVSPSRTGAIVVE